MGMRIYFKRSSLMDKISPSAVSPGADVCSLARALRYEVPAGIKA